MGRSRQHRYVQTVGKINIKLGIIDINCEGREWFYPNIELCLQKGQQVELIDDNHPVTNIVEIPLGVKCTLRMKAPKEMFTEWEEKSPQLKLSSEKRRTLQQKLTESLGLSRRQKP